MAIIKNIMLTLTLGATMIAGGGIAIAKSNKKDKNTNSRTEQYCNNYCNNTCNDNSNNACNQNCTTPPPCPPDSYRFHGRHHHPGMEPGRPHGRPGHASDIHAMKGLDLTQAQKDSVKSIMKRQKQTILDGERQLRQQARENADKELQQILTPEQFAKYQANREQFRKDAPKGPKCDEKHLRDEKRHHGDKNCLPDDLHHNDCKF